MTEYSYTPGWNKDHTIFTDSMGNQLQAQPNAPPRRIGKNITALIPFPTADEPGDRIEDEQSTTKYRNQRGI